MKKTKFLSLFLALTILLVPSGKADVIEPAVHARLRSARLYQHVKTGLEKSITAALRSATPQSDKLLIKLFGAYCLIIADHVHWSPIKSHYVRRLGSRVRVPGNSVRVPGVPSARIPRDVSQAFTLQNKVRTKLRESPTFRDAIPSEPIITWVDGKRHYLCNPDLVYEKLPKRYRQDSLEYVAVFSNFAVAPTMHRASRSC